MKNLTYPIHCTSLVGYITIKIKLRKLENRDIAFIPEGVCVFISFQITLRDPCVDTYIHLLIGLCRQGFPHFKYKCVYYANCNVKIKGSVISLLSKNCHLLSVGFLTSHFYGWNYLTFDDSLVSTVHMTIVVS